MAEIIISRAHLSQVISHCRASYPNEACGILSGTGNTVRNVYTMTNAEPSPVSYFMEPQEQFRVMKAMREEGQRMVAIFHSHPHSPAYPSAKDVTLAFYSDAAYVIVSLARADAPEVRAFTIMEGEVKEISVQAVD
jgi:[CysO sulfur-carrier protein]-S-L-cysteine hydrolase